MKEDQSENPMVARHSSPVTRRWVLILLGAPGAGKGTQAREVSSCLGIPHISTGDILREAAERGTPLGLVAQRKMEAGELVPDKVVYGLVKERIGQPDCRNSFVLDGFPRTLGQAQYLDRLLRSRGWSDPLVLNIRVDQQLLIKRLTGRRTCPVCGTIYNVFFKPPQKEGFCDREGAKLIHRADDNEEAIGQRLAAYENQTKPLIEYYAKKSVLHDVDGNRKPETVTKELCQFLRDHDHLQISSGN